jgi:hypothetical protein
VVTWCISGEVTNLNLIVGKDKFTRVLVIITSICIQGGPFDAQDREIRMFCSNYEYVLVLIEQISFSNSPSACGEIRESGYGNLN